MTTFARIQDAIVVELFSPPDDVPISDCFVPEVAAQFVPVPDGMPVEVGWIATEADGIWSFAAPADPPPPTLPEQATAILSAPVNVVCGSRSTLNGTYPNDDPTRSQMAAIMTKINAGNGLPGGGTTFNWPDVTGGIRDWPSKQFSDYASQMADFVYQAVQVQQGHSTTLPSTTLTLP